MTKVRAFLYRALMLFHRPRIETEINEEIRSHLEMAADDQIHNGMTDDDARRAALRNFGGVDQMKERCRDQYRFQPVESFFQDVRFALRTLRKTPGFTVVAVMTLGVGIGVNAAVFSVTNAALFKGFRLVDRNDRILYIGTQKNGRGCCVSYPDFEDWRAEAKSFEGLGAAADLQMILSDDSGSGHYDASQVSANTFQLLGQKPIIGRDFVAADEVLGAAPVAILSYGFWERRYGKSPAIIGQTVRINGVATTVIGVMAQGFSFPQNLDLWLPLVPTPNLQKREARGIWFAFGRLRNGVTVQSARAEMETIGSRLATAYPRTNEGQIPQLQSFAEFFIGPNATLIYGALWAAVGFVLLIACANLANLLLDRAVGRSREISVRMALGAGRWRIVRQLLIESLVLSIMGGVCGSAIAQWAVRTYELATNRPVGEWNHNLLNYAMDHRVLAYLVAISIGTGVLFGLAPALWFSSRLNLQTALKDGRGTTGGRNRKRLSGLLVIGEVALTVVLLASAGVMIRSFLHLYTADVGADIANMRTMLLHLPDGKYTNPETRISFFDRLKTHLDAIPGVESASIGAPPADGNLFHRPFYELADARTVDEKSRPTIPVVTIGPDYFRTLGTPVLFGREFNTFDQVSALSAVVNERFARQHWAGGDAVGQRLRLFDGETPQPWLTIVGVVSNIVYDRSRQEVAPLVYIPYGQTNAAAMWILIRTSLPISGLATTFRHEISLLDPDVLIWLGPYNLADRLAFGLYEDLRTQAALLLIFAAIALLLASIGLYTVIAHSVSQRTQELGIRIAIGATAHDIRKLVFMQGMLPLGIGLIIGLTASFAVTPVLKSVLVQVSPVDPITLVLASLMLVLSATLGCWIPARRAVRVDPVLALRHE